MSNPKRHVVGAVSLLLVAVSFQIPFAGAVEPQANATAAAPTVLMPGLHVEQVRWMREALGGGRVEVRYRLIAVQELPASPRETYVLQPETGAKLRVRRVPMLPPTVMDPEQAPLAKLVLRDEAGVIQPGQKVTVVVAGLQRTDVPVVGDPGSDNTAAALALEGPTIPRQSEPPRGAVDLGEQASLEVVRLMTSGGGALLDLRYRLAGVDRILPNDQRNTYIEDPKTGDRFYVLGVTRIGTLATKAVGPRTTSYLLANNRGKRIKVGDRVTVVVAGLKQEDVLVEE